jgi:hypothetical protein
MRSSVVLTSNERRCFLVAAIGLIGYLSGCAGELPPRVPSVVESAPVAVLLRSKILAPRVDTAPMLNQGTLVLLFADEYQGTSADELLQRGHWFDDVASAAQFVHTLHASVADAPQAGQLLALSGAETLLQAFSFRTPAEVDRDSSFVDIVRPRSFEQWRTDTDRHAARDCWRLYRLPGQSTGVAGFYVKWIMDNRSVVFRSFQVYYVRSIAEIESTSRELCRPQLDVIPAEVDEPAVGLLIPTIEAAAAIKRGCP